MGKNFDELNDSKPSRQERPMFLFAGVLNQVERLSPTSELLRKVELWFDPPWVGLDLRDHHVTWNGTSLLENIEEGDIVVSERKEYEHDVRAQLEKWNGVKYTIASKVIPYNVNLGLLPTYLSLLDKLERERLFIPFLA